MNAGLYRQAFDRIRAEFMEMPGMQLTPPQVQRLSGVDAVICKLVLDDLVRAKFLRLGADGSYARGNEGAPRLQTAKVDWDVRPRRPSERVG